MRAFIFDLNGTMIDDMDCHVRAWLHLVNEVVMDGFTYEQVKKEMFGKNSEVLKRLFGEKYFSAFELDNLSRLKEERYRREYLPLLKLLPGLDRFLATAHAYSIPMAIASAACMENIDFVLDNLGIRHYFQTIVSAADVTISKPHPETFLKAAEGLGVSPEACIVFEDAPKGVEAALLAGMKCVVLTTMHGKEDFHAYPNIVSYVADYTDGSLEQLFT